ncbi:polysaccharide biosynthesis protein [Cohnella boryungensis]|uniref:Polysaccharide biosynthesis protein n=1 Tax=Cohnella boryungensis TaxID=768479 RepID=A0ABV8S7X7_9BACL
MNIRSRYLLLLLIDVLIIASAIYISYLLRFDYKIRNEYGTNIPYVISACTIFVISSLHVYKIYKKVWQYASVGDLIAITKGVFVGIGLFYIFHQYVVLTVFPAIVVPRSIYLLAAMVIFLGISASRFVWRIVRDNYRKIKPYHRKALIVGAGSAGIMVVKELKHSSGDLYPVAFVDDDVQKMNYEVLGVPVVGNRYSIPEVANKYEIQEIILAMPSSSRAELSSIINIAKQTGCQIKTIPRMNDLINGKVSIDHIRNVSVDDLLGRDPVKLELDEITSYLSNQVILVTGAGGSIGSELCRQIAKFSPKQLILLGHGENSIFEIEMELKEAGHHFILRSVIADIQDIYALDATFAKYKPRVVFHAAAHKHVSLMENNPSEAVKNNILGTRNVATCADKYGCDTFVLVSTDKAVNPTNVMGATKNVAEMVAQTIGMKSKTKFSAVRFGNVLGSRGSVIPIFQRQIKAGGPVTVTHPDMIRYFMTIPEAVQLIIQAGAIASGGETFVLDMGHPVKIADLAKDIIRLSGFEPGKDIKIEYTGIRPGEKLFEELLTADEGAVASKHDRIFIIRSHLINGEEFELALRRLEALSSLKEGSVHAEAIKAELHKLVPSYAYQQSSEEEKERALKESFQSSLEVVSSLE